MQMKMRMPSHRPLVPGVKYCVNSCRSYASGVWCLQWKHERKILAANIGSNQSRMRRKRCNQRANQLVEASWVVILLLVCHSVKAINGSNLGKKAFEQMKSLLKQDDKYKKIDKMWVGSNDDDSPRRTKEGSVEGVKLAGYGEMKGVVKATVEGVLRRGADGVEEGSMYICMLRGSGKMLALFMDGQAGANGWKELLDKMEKDSSVEKDGDEEGCVGVFGKVKFMMGKEKGVSDDLDEHFIPKEKYMMEKEGVGAEFDGHFIAYTLMSVKEWSRFWNSGETKTTLKTNALELLRKAKEEKKTP